VLAEALTDALLLSRPQFVPDSLLEEDGFEPSVPPHGIRRSLSRKGEVPLGGVADEYAQVQRHLEAKGLKITTGAIVDATVTSSTKMQPSLRRGASGISAGRRISASTVAAS
jgi:hypothetical protein